MSQPPPPPGAPYPPSAYQPQYQMQPPMYAAQPGNGIGTAAGVIGIIAIVLSFIPFVDYVSFVLGPLAIIFGAIGISRSRRRGGSARGMAITGLVLGIISLIISTIFAVAVYSALRTATQASPQGNADACKAQAEGKAAGLSASKWDQVSSDWASAAGYATGAQVVGGSSAAAKAFDTLWTDSETVYGDLNFGTSPTGDIAKYNSDLQAAQPYLQGCR